MRDEDQTDIEIHAIIHGRVQGVGFRAKVHQYAEQFGLLGKVRNLSDGSVEIFAFGKRVVVEKFLQFLREGDHGIASISSISSGEVFPPHFYKDFRITF